MFIIVVWTDCVDSLLPKNVPVVTILYNEQ